MTSLSEVYSLDEVSFAMGGDDAPRLVCRGALALLNWAETNLDGELVRRAQRASERIGRTMDPTRVQDQHWATVLLVADAKEKAGGRKEDLKGAGHALLYARKRLGLDVRNAFRDDAEGED